MYKASWLVWTYHQFLGIYFSQSFSKTRINAEPLSRKVMPSRCRFLRQSVTLVGAKCLAFEDVLKSIIQAQALFSRVAKDGKLDDWEPTFLSDDVGITASNRYFQHREETQPEDVISLDPEIDPHHVLSEAASGNYLHTVNNRVEYYERVEGKEGAPR